MTNLTPLLPARPTRISVTLTSVDGTPIGSAGVMSVGVMDGTTFIALASVNRYIPSVTLSVERYGSLLLLPIVLGLSAGATGSGTVVDVFLNDDLSAA